MSPRYPPVYAFQVLGLEEHHNIHNTQLHFLNVGSGSRPLPTDIPFPTMPLQHEKTEVRKTTVSYSFCHHPKDSDPDETDKRIKEDEPDPSSQCVLLMQKVCLAPPP